MRGLFVVAAALAAGCGAGEIESGGHAMLHLRAEGGGLVLDGSPLDRGYHARYDNPRAITSMKVVIGPLGEVTGVCRDAAGTVIPCGDVPFIARARTHDATGGRTIEAWDEHGEKVVAYACTDEHDPACQGASDEEEAAEEECGNDEHGYGDDGDGDDDNTGGGGGDGGDACPPPPTDCAAMETWARDCFCQMLHDNLDEFGVDATVDCDALDDDTDYGTGYGGDHEGDIACRNDLIEEGEDHVEDAADDAECEAVEIAVHNWASAVDHELRSAGHCGSSPLVLDLAGDGVSLTTLADGTRFDLLGRGEPVAVAWIQGDDGFLALDRDGNGMIEGAAELFGNQTAGRAFADGFAALAELDADGDGRVDARDPGYAALVVWRDADRDGVGTADELVGLAAAGVAALELAHERVSGKAAWDGRGNRIPLVGRFAREGGGTAALVDAYLRYAPGADDAAYTCPLR